MSSYLLSCLRKYSIILSRNYELDPPSFTSSLGASEDIPLQKQIKHGKGGQVSEVHKFDQHQSIKDIVNRLLGQYLKSIVQIVQYMARNIWERQKGIGWRSKNHNSINT